MAWRPNDQILKRLPVIATLICMLLLLLQGAVSYLAYLSLVGDSRQQWDQNALARAEDSLSSAIGEMTGYLERLCVDDRLQALAEDWAAMPSASYRKWELQNEIVSLLNVLQVRYAQIAGIALIAEGTGLYSGLADMPPLPEAEDTEPAFWTQSWEGALCVLFSHPYPSLGARGRLVLVMQSRWVGQVLDDNPFLAVLSEGEPLYEPAPLQPEARAAYRTMAGTGWQIRLADSGQERLQPLQRVLWTTLSGFCLTSVLAMLLSRLLLRRLAVPMELFERMALEHLRRDQPIEVAFHDRRRRFGDGVMAYLCLVWFVPLCVATAIYCVSTARLVENVTRESLEQHLLQTVHSVDAFMEQVDRMSASLAVSSSVQQALVERGRNAEGALHALQQTVALHRLPGDVVAGIHIFTADGALYHASDGKKASVPEPVRLAFAGNYPFPMLTRSDGQVSLWRRIRNVLPGIASLMDHGYARVFLSEQALNQALQATGLAQMRTWIVDETGEVLLGEAAAFPEGLGEAGLVSWAGTLYAAAPLKERSWRLICAIAPSEMLVNSALVPYINLTMLLISLLLLLVVSSRLSLRYARSMEVLQYNLLGWKTPNKDLSQGVEDSEIARVAHTFNRMSARIQQLLAASYESRIRDANRESQRREAELRALQAQINPHFLYNTLESLKYLVCEGEAERAEEMIDLLGDLLRASADAREALIPLREELSYARTYAALQAIRYEDRLAVTWTVEEDCLECLVPKLILQPLLENALVHGKQRKDRLHIAVTARARNRVLRISVENDGNAVPQAELAALQALLAGAETSSDGIGLLNVHQRIRLYFGADYGASLDNLEGGGVWVGLRLPVQYPEG